MDTREPAEKGFRRTRQRLAGEHRLRVVTGAFILYALFGAGREALLWGAVLVLAGLPIYFWQRRT